MILRPKKYIIPCEIYFWKLLLKIHLLSIFIYHRLSLPAKWKIILVPLWVAFILAKKIKNKTLKDCFFLMKILQTKRVVRL